MRGKFGTWWQTAFFDVFGQGLSDRQIARTAPCFDIRKPSCHGDNVLIDCIKKIRSLGAETGVNNLICWMNFGGMPQELVKNSMELFATEVVPNLRDDVPLADLPSVAAE